jgi:hypothetical protein
VSIIEIGHDGAVWISRNLYCKTPEALAASLDKLRGIGYKIEDQRIEGYAIRKDRVTVEQMEQNGWSLWFARLPELRKGKCDSCNSYISVGGIRSHGHTCEICGAVTYRELIEGSTVRFRFSGDEQVMFGPELNMTVKKWDAEAGFLYLRTEFLEHGGLCVVSGDKAKNYMARHSDKWDLVEDDGEQVYKIHYADSFYIQPDAVIEMIDTWGHEWNHKIVLVWDGKEYQEYFNDLPVPETVSIYEAWHWAPLEPSPTLHKKVLGAIGNSDDKGWHYQDGRPWFTARSFEEMGKFVRHFTTLDADEWDSRGFRTDGPGGIDDVAAFCHPHAEVEDRPHIGNFLNGFGKAMSGQMLTDGEAEAMTRAWNEDRDTTDFAHAVLAHAGEVRRGTQPLPTKIPRRLKKALRKPLSRRTTHERRKVWLFLRRHR